MAKRAPARNSRPCFSSEVFPMTAPAIPAPAPATGRLGNGQLRRQVAEWLAARPGPHTVGEIAKDLGRPAGAVGNALTPPADRAEAAPLAGKPMRHDANAPTPAAAPPIAPKAPPPPQPPPRPPPARPAPAPPPAKPMPHEATAAPAAAPPPLPPKPPAPPKAAPAPAPAPSPAASPPAPKPAAPPASPAPKAPAPKAAPGPVTRP